MDQYRFATVSEMTAKARRRNRDIFGKYQKELGHGIKSCRWMKPFPTLLGNKI